MPEAPSGAEASSVDAPSPVPGANAPTATPNPGAPQSPKHRVKIDGKEEEVSFDDLVRGFQKGRGAESKMAEAARLRKEWEVSRDKTLSDVRGQVLKEAREFYAANPRQAIKDLGLPDDYFSKAALEDFEESLLTDDERELRQHRSEAQKRKDAQEKATKKAEEQKLQHEMHAAITEIDTEIGEVLTASNLQPTPLKIKRIAEHILASLKDDGTRINATEAYSRYRKDVRADMTELVEELPVEELAALFPSLLAKVRKHSIDKVKPKLPSFATGTPPAQTQTAPRRGQTRMTLAEKLEKQYGVKI